MKILAVADLHYSLPQFDWLLKVSSRYDLVIIAGDLLEGQSSVSTSAQMQVVLKYLERLRDKTKLLVCSGNHDLNYQYSTGEKYARWVQYARSANLHTDGDSVELGGTKFSVFPWWDGGIAKNAIAKQLAAAVPAEGGPWVWVYHAPPTAAAVAWSGQRHFGDELLAEWIKQYSPALVFAGHVHEAPFARGGSWVERVGDTWIFNAGKQIGDFPTHICIDTERREAVWFSLENGMESISLDSPSAADRQPLYEMPAWLLNQSRESPEPVTTAAT
ncbi:MAG: metallophosphoesterase [Devosia sp.]